ncbi:MAG: cytochrome b/b6 domain-containing protein [Hyphomicrobiaceae bacterium]|nr:cytochrome b/b6 domain-containing protein [Hyphomicrobiaceae bacterium]
MDLKKPIFDNVSMILHWTVAALVFSVGLSSPFLDNLVRPGLSTFHNVGGTVVLLLAAGWCVWQLRRPPLPSLAAIGATEQTVMKGTIGLLNVLMIVGSASGLELLFAYGGSLGVGSFAVSHAIPVDQLAAQRLSLLHHVLGALLVMVAGGHALHSLWHHVVRRDRLLARMLPGHEQ